MRSAYKITETKGMNVVFIASCIFISNQLNTFEYADINRKQYISETQHFMFTNKTKLRISDKGKIVIGLCFSYIILSQLARLL